jgi:hypothetical protein
MSIERNQLYFLTRSTLYLNIKVDPNHIYTLKENVKYQAFRAVAIIEGQSYRASRDGSRKRARVCRKHLEFVSQRHVSWRRTTDTLVC